MIDVWITDWLGLLARWFHLVVGAAWIGTSFYFNWLNNHVRPVDDPSGRLARTSELRKSRMVRRTR